MSILLAICLPLAVMTSGLMALWVKPFLVLTAAYLCFSALPRRVDIGMVDLLIAGLFGWMALSLFWSVDPFYSASSLVIMALLPVVYASVRFGELSLQIFINMAAVVVLSPFFYWLLGADNLFFPWLNANQYCAFVNMIAVFMMMRCFSGEGRFWDWGWLFLVQIVLHLTTSRTGIVVHFGLLLCLPFLIHKLYNQSWLWRCQIVLIMTFFILFFIIQTPIMGGDISDHFSARTVLVRGDVWAASLMAYADFPFLGTGLGSFVSAYEAYRVSGDVTSGLSAHNDLLHLLVELGPVAVVFGVGLFGYAFIQLVKTMQNPRHLTLLAMLGVYGAHGVLTTLWPHPVLLLALAVIFAHVPQQMMIQLCIKRGVLAGFLGVWVIYTGLITMGGMHMRMAQTHMQQADLENMIHHLQLANRFYVPDHPGATDMLQQIETVLENLPETLN